MGGRTASDVPSKATTACYSSLGSIDSQCVGISTHDEYSMGFFGADLAPLTSYEGSWCNFFESYGTKYFAVHCQHGVGLRHPRPDARACFCGDCSTGQSPVTIWASASFQHGLGFRDDAVSRYSSTSFACSAWHVSDSQRLQPGDGQHCLGILVDSYV